MQKNPRERVVHFYPFVIHHGNRHRGFNIIVISSYIIKYINYIEYFEININFILLRFLKFIIYIKDRELNIYIIKYLKIIIFLSRKS